MPTSVGPSVNQSDEDFLGTGEGIPLLLHCTRFTDDDHHHYLGDDRDDGDGDDDDVAGSKAFWESAQRSRSLPLTLPSLTQVHHHCHRHHQC